MRHFKFIRGRYAKSIMAIIPGLYFLKKIYLFFFFFLLLLLFVLHSSALYNEISDYVAVVRTVDIVKNRSCAMPLLNILIYNKIIKQTVKPAVHVQNMSGLNMLQFKINYVLSRIKHNS